MRGLAWGWATAALVVAIVGLSRPAAAQEPAPPEEAVEFFDRARVAYGEGRYEEAAVELERALVLDPSAPTLLFNLARVYELLGRYDDSIDVLLRARASIPPDDAGEHERIEQTLERLRGAREHSAPPPSVEVVGQLVQGPTFVHERGVADEAFWATLLSGVVVIGVAGALGGHALSVHDGLRGRVLHPDLYTYDDYQAELARSRALALASDVLMGVGGATVIASIFVFALRERILEQAPDHATLAPSIHLDLGLGGISLRGEF